MRSKWHRVGGRCKTARAVAAVGVLAMATSFARPVSAEPAAGTELPALDRLEHAWNALHDYTASIFSHEQIGDRSSDHELRYEFRKTDRARLDIISGTRAGVTLIWTGSDRIYAYKRGLSFFKLRGDIRSDALTSVRGNGILTPNIGDILACFEAHRAAIEERSGPTIDGKPTEEIALPYAGVACPDDSPLDRSTVTLDVLEIDPTSGLIVERRRYAGNEIVERWIVHSRTVDAGISDGEFR